MAQLVDIKKDFDLGNRFLLDTATELAKLLSDDYRVVVKYDLQDYKFPKDNKKNVLFALSRETHDLPRYVDEDSVFMIFHNYSMLDNWGYPSEHPNVFPLPLGTFINDIFEKVEEIKTFEEREYDFCFVGQMPNTGTRDKFKKNLDYMLERCGDKFKYFVKGLRESNRLPAVKREKIFIDMCESVHPRDAELLVAMINKEPPTKGITKELVKEAFPDLI